MPDSNVKIEVHLIQNFAPSNLNRDDTGQPKSAMFGGFRRARISSQCEKRATRLWWRKDSTVTVGDRTKRLQKRIRDRLGEDVEFKKKVEDVVKKKECIGENKEDTDAINKGTEEYLKDGVRVFTDAYYASADTKDPEKTNVLVFIGPNEVDVCVQSVKELWDDRSQVVQKKGKDVQETVEGIASIAQKVREFNSKNAGKQENPDESVSEQADEDQAASDAGNKKKPKKPKLVVSTEILNRIKHTQLSADIALFGRMLAEQPELNTDGACQVAHPISTHKVDMEMDFYTAVDDLNPEKETGAGMMGVVGFNSACYYRYALVDRDQLARNLARKTERNNGGWAHELTQKDYSEADKVIRAFIEAMVYATPTGKQNSFAAQNLPSFGLLTRRVGGVPVSLANAFAKPVRPKKEDDDVVGLSVDALTKHWDALKTVYGGQGVKTTACFHLQQEGRLNGLAGSDKKNVAAAIESVLCE
jgi:CRISPR system Cascade subunit CasC